MQPKQISETFKPVEPKFTYFRELGENLYVIYYPRGRLSGAFCYRYGEHAFDASQGVSEHLHTAGKGNSHVPRCPESRSGYHGHAGLDQEKFGEGGIVLDT